MRKKEKERKGQKREKEKNLFSSSCLLPPVALQSRGCSSFPRWVGGVKGQRSGRGNTADQLAHFKEAPTLEATGGCYYSFSCIFFRIEKNTFTVWLVMFVTAVAILFGCYFLMNVIHLCILLINYSFICFLNIKSWCKFPHCGRNKGLFLQCTEALNGISFASFSLFLEL